MNSLLNSSRPPVFCPGCAHERIVHALDQAFQNLGLAGEQIAIVSDIGCSGLFDTFFNTHAFHGLHGRALTYATGIKMARPDLHVVVTMGDGGLGIGGAHVLSTCRRNIDLTLLVLNNFNYGMTGGQCSSTTPQDAKVGSGFLNRLEKPIDICQVAGAAGAGMVTRVSTYAKELVDTLQVAIRFEGFSLVDIWGICPGRYTRRNKLTPHAVAQQLGKLPDVDAYAAQNARKEYGRAYREEAAGLRPVSEPLRIDPQFTPPVGGRQEVVVLGSAGQRIITAGEILCLAGAVAGLHATQKNDYPITVMRGHSVSELILSETEIDYTGIERPATVIALAQEGVDRRKALFSKLSKSALVLKARGLELPATEAAIIDVDFKARKIKSQDWALAALAMLARQNRGFSLEMLKASLALRFKGAVLEQTLSIVDRADA
jgi:pyruvate/2-oxoacid:ferredoxin oxidoreductase beta subunit/Pyruvate/2-oxoacid:ferredoxin oxidoreductase gamma subunit